MLNQIRQRYSHLKSRYIGRTTEEVRTEDLYRLLTHPQMENDPFVFRFEYYDESYDKPQNSGAVWGREQKIPDAVIRLQEEIDQDPTYDVNLNIGKYGGLKVKATTKLDRPRDDINLNPNKSDISDPLEDISMYSCANRVTVETWDRPRLEGIEQFGKLSISEAVHVLEGEKSDN